MSAARPQDRPPRRPRRGRRGASSIEYGLIAFITATAIFAGALQLGIGLDTILMAAGDEIDESASE